MSAVTALTPSQRSGSGSHCRDVRPAHGSDARSSGSSSPDHRGERAAGERGGRHAVAHVAAGEGEPRAPIVAHGGVPVTGHAEVATPRSA